MTPSLPWADLDPSGQMPGRPTWNPLPGNPRGAGGLPFSPCQTPGSRGAALPATSSLSSSLTCRRAKEPPLNGHDALAPPRAPCTGDKLGGRSEGSGAAAQGAGQVQTAQGPAAEGHAAALSSWQRVPGQRLRDAAARAARPRCRGKTHLPSVCPHEAAAQPAVGGGRRATRSPGATCLGPGSPARKAQPQFRDTALHPRFKS